MLRSLRLCFVVRRTLAIAALLSSPLLPSAWLIGLIRVCDAPGSSLAVEVVHGSEAGANLVGAIGTAECSYLHELVLVMMRR